MAENISIVPLYEKPEYAPILAHWSYSEWYLKRDIPFDVNLKAYQRRSQSRKIPLSLVAIVGTVPVGMVSLKENDLWSRKDLNPWLASLFVLKEYRHIGVGTMLVRQLVREAEALGYAGLHLFSGTMRRVISAGTTEISDGPSLNRQRTTMDAIPISIITGYPVKGYDEGSKRGIYLASRIPDRGDFFAAPQPLRGGS